MPNESEKWTRLVPAAPVLLADDKWSVVVSHGAVDDVWLVNVCDALRTGGHTVFLDGPATGDLAQLRNALERSQAGLVLWSSSARDAARMEQAVAAMSARAGSGAFRFVIARVRGTTLPPFATTASAVEWSLYPEGPGGGEALRLLLALAGQPIDAATEAAATEFDATARAFIDQRKELAANVEGLRALIAIGGPWELSPALGAAIPMRLIGLGKYDQALETIDKVTQRFPAAHRPKQVRALALARRGKATDLGAAQHILASLYNLAARDPETVGIYARTFMDEYNATGNAASLRRSRDLYAEAYRLSPDSYYTGINAAAKSVFLQTEEDVTRGREYAALVQRDIGTEAIPGDYWKSATVAEAHLILGNYSNAAKVYQWAVNLDPEDRSSHSTTWKQASKLMAVLRVKPAERARIREAFKNPPASPSMDVSQEIRFAIVMYGGVSLAIYINGVAQEFLRLVRATAADPKDRNQPLFSDAELTGTERVYRRAAQLIGRERDGAKRPVTQDDPIRARFVIDILSGTSAGGINAMFLAKALANNQSIDQLKQLWIDEGAIERLINDGKSVEKLDGLPAENPPTSLLNGRRMYRKLLDAFDGMDRATQPKASYRSPLVDELDLFVTTTDIRGLPVSLRLADDIVEELRHRNVFRFRYSDGFTTEATNDFLAETNPFLAYAARCTSSFPFAFPPMKLSDIDEVLRHTPDRRGETGRGESADKWRRFFPAYTAPKSGKAFAPDVYDFKDRAFGDGGYLDNKPFGHATDALRTRRGGLPSRRKLVFIEPSPEYLNATARNGDRPNIIENVSAALSLARYETIRDDLDRVRGRNRLVERVGQIIGGMEFDVRIGRTVTTEIRKDFGALDLKEMIERYGIAYGGYHRLKVASLTDELAGLLSRIAEYDDRSDEFLAIRYLIRAWRESRFVAYIAQLGDAPRSNTTPPVVRQTENQFLAKYDLPYRLRRLEFVIGKVDQLSSVDRVTEDLFQQTAAAAVPRSEGDRDAFRAELARLRGELRSIYEPLRRGRDLLQTRGATNPLAESLSDLAVSQADLHRLLECGTDHERFEFACKLLVDPRRQRALDRLADTLAVYISTLTFEASKRCDTLLPTLTNSADQTTIPTMASAPPGSNPFAAVAIDLVRHYYNFYERYDLISYPVFQSADVGDELDTVDVVRISPEDARSLIDERRTDRRKLAGTTLMNFGAFLDRNWRQNDILWGRMDGAERILSTILPANEPEMASLLEEAQLAILEEEYRGADRDRLSQLLIDGFAAQGSLDASEAELRDLAAMKPGAGTNPALQAVLRKSFDTKELLGFFRDSYAVNRNLDPQAATQSLARSTRVIGKLLRQLSNEYNVGDSPTRWLTRFAQAFWALIEVAVPDSFPNLIVRHWLKLLYLFQGLLILGGTFTGMPIQRFGFMTLALTISVHLALLTLGDVMRGHRQWLRRAGAAIAVLLLVTLAVGVYALANDATRSFLWHHIVSQLRDAANLPSPK